MYFLHKVIQGTTMRVPLIDFLYYTDEMERRKSYWESWVYCVVINNYVTFPSNRSTYKQSRMERSTNYWHNGNDLTGRRNIPWTIIYYDEKPSSFFWVLFVGWLIYKRKHFLMIYDASTWVPWWWPNDYL